MNETEPSVRPLACDEIPLLRTCLEKLAAYHNRVATSFSGLYPIMPIDLHLDHMRDHVRNGTAHIIGLFMPDGELSGFGMASFEAEYGEIDYLYVNRDMRGDGHGTLLVEELLRYLREKGASLVNVQLVLGNPSKEFYEKFGFRTRSETMSLTL